MLIKRLKDCAEFTAGDGSILREFLHPDKENVVIHYSLAHAIVKAGQKTKRHRLRTSEVYYILEGEGQMHIDDESQKVTVNEVIYIPSYTVQYIENTGKKDLKFLCFVDPAWTPGDEEIL